MLGMHPQAPTSVGLCLLSLPVPVWVQGGVWGSSLALSRAVGPAGCLDL